MKKILIINGHPNKDSFNHALANSYENGAMASNATISRIDIGSLDFNPNLETGYQTTLPLESDLQESIKKIQQADHIVWVFPMWWYSSPAIMKGFIDRVFLPDITYKFEGKPFPKQLLKGKTGRIVITADTPNWYNRLVMRNPAVNQLKKGTLEFCGVKPVKVSYIGPIKKSSDKFRQKWLERIESLGRKLQ